MVMDLLRAEPKVTEDYPLYQFKDVIPSSNGKAGTNEILAEFNHALATANRGDKAVVLADYVYFEIEPATGMTLALVTAGADCTDPSAVLFELNRSDGGLHIGKRASDEQVAKSLAYKAEAERRRQQGEFVIDYQKHLNQMFREYTEQQLNAATLQGTQAADIDYVFRNCRGDGYHEKLRELKLLDFIQILAILGHKDLPRF